MEKTLGENYFFLPKSVAVCLKEKFKSLEEEGITYIAHGIKRKGIRTCFFSHESWGNTFIRERKYEVDPFTILSETTKSPVIFWEDVEMDTQGKEVHLYRKDMCGIYKGLTFSNHCYDFHEIIALGTSKKLFDIKSMALNPSLYRSLSLLLQPIRYSHLCYVFKSERFLGYE